MTHRRPADAGLTLVEVLAVLAIVGVAAGATVLGLGSLDRGARSEGEAMRLADRLQLAADDAMVTSAPLALVWTERSYEFVAWDPQRGGWHASERRELGPRHTLAGALRLERAGSRDDAPILIAPDLLHPSFEFRVTGGGDVWRVAFDGFRSSARVMPQ
jgi:general secretion pathway protein H